MPGSSPSCIVIDNVRSRSVNVLGGLRVSSTISIVPFSIVTSGGLSLSFGSGNRRDVFHVPSGRRVIRSVGRRTTTSAIRGSEVASSASSVGQRRNTSSRVSIAARGTFRAGIEDRQPSDLDPFALHPSG